MKNYFYIYGSGSTMRLFFVDAKRKATVVAAGPAWQATTARAWYGVNTNRVLLPVVGCN